MLRLLHSKCYQNNFSVLSFFIEVHFSLISAFIFTWRRALVISPLTLPIAVKFPHVTTTQAVGTSRAARGLVSSTPHSVSSTSFKKKTSEFIKIFLCLTVHQQKIGRRSSRSLNQTPTTQIFLSLKEIMLDT